ncbi:P-loop NTPase fold protein [Myroides sp. N17-2]|uniref:P-loop NTPase fold protein n=1 Tax=Myroides sp. N17-2 TaxID=2030799 RepID=UPI000EFC5561|nr:P-loop NTPase fold protein [Myroides sp. N17-2]
MSHLEKIKISNESIIVDFQEHLELEYNQRILFTAPFGAGKSTFIDDFKNQHQEGYRFIRLYPVNYAVSANEDIFELIKFDILYELIAHHNEEIALEKEDFNFWLRMSMFMQNKADLMPLFLHIISLHETIGKPVAKFIEVVKPLVKDFKTYSKKINIDETGDVFGFLETFESKKGSPYEMDATSQFIFDLVDRLKGDELPDQEEIEEDKKRTNKTVLVIDDLDRLDPDHIFRLFNIFSAHTHSISGENKFGFDKVIFVCDIENIRKIYAHKYGQGVDFSGYMDKFYSIRPFVYDNFKYLTQKITAIIDQSTFSSQSQIVVVKTPSVVYLLSAVLKILSKNKAINLRSLLKSSTFLLSIEEYVTIKNNITLSKNKISLVVVFEIISEMLGGWVQLEKALLLVKEYSSNKHYFDMHQQFLDKYNLTNYNYGHEVDFLKREIFKVFVGEYLKNEDMTTDGNRVIQLHEFKLDVVYNLRYEDIDDFKIKYIREIGGDDNIDYKVNYDLLLIEAFRKLQEYGFIPKN